LTLLERVSLFAAVMGTAAFLCRWICSGATDRLWVFRILPGDIAVLGSLPGIILAGTLIDLPDHTPTQKPAPPPQPSNSPLAVGKTLDLAGPTLDGGRFDLAQHRGKVALVEFWRTRCEWCQKELPNVRAVYNKYHANGLEVVGVNLDTKREDLARYVKANRIRWPQIFFDQPGKTGWKNPLAVRYGVKATPRLLLIDREGKVAASSVRDRAIEWAVARVLSPPGPDARLVRPSELPTEDQTPLPRRLFGWLVTCLVVAPPWLLILGGLGGAVLGALAELAIRRALGFGPAPRQA
jgi:thiol-disulfide isomerase/thioredoxin